MNDCPKFDTSTDCDCYPVSGRDNFSYEQYCRKKKVCTELRDMEGNF